MNDRLAAVLVHLSDPSNAMRFEEDRQSFVDDLDLPPLDKEILAHGDRNLLRLHARLGNVTPELLAAAKAGDATNDQGAALNMHEHLFEFEHEHDAAAAPDPNGRSYGPHARFLD